MSGRRVEVGDPARRGELGAQSAEIAESGGRHQPLHGGAWKSHRSGAGYGTGRGSDAVPGGHSVTLYLGPHRTPVKHYIDIYT